MKLDKAVHLVGEAEEDLAEKLSKLAGRHATEHDIYHLGHTLAERSREHLTKLKPFADDLGAARPDLEAGTATSRPTDTLRRAAGTILGRSEVTGVVLLLDLRDAYLTAQAAEINWVILLQTAKAARHLDLETLATSCREETEGTAKWLRTRIKETTPQVLATS
jgi:hypothetical protein